MFWTLEQALAWAMWRDEDRVAGVGDGRPDILLPWRSAESPILSEDEKDDIVGWLLEHGDVRLIPTEDGPSREREVRWALHEVTGCFPWVEGWRERAGAPLCTDGELNWDVPKKEPLLDFKGAWAELLQALRSGAARSIGEDAGLQRVNLSAKDWLYAEPRLSTDRNRGGYRSHDLIPTATGPSRLRFYATEIKALWPPVSITPTRRVSGAAEGKLYKADAIKRAAGDMLDREKKGRSTTDDDIISTLVDFSRNHESPERGAMSEKTAGRWVSKVRDRMEELRRDEG